MKKIAIIPARGGSKRIPRKNIKLFLEKPIIAYSIEAVLKSDLFDEVMVSTDDEEIGNLAKSLGAKVPFYRKETTSNDFATTFEVIEEVINNYKNLGQDFDYGCCLYPTAPFTTPSQLSNFYHFLTKNNFDSVFPVLRYGYPIQRALTIDDNNKISMLNPEHLITRSQDLEATYHDAGQFYWFHVQRLLRKKKLWTNNSGTLEINEMEAHDIDNIQDWEVAEFKFKFKQNSKSK